MRPRTRLPDLRSRIASATIDASTEATPSDHHGQLQRRRRGDEAGVDVDPRGQPRLGGHLQVGEDPGDLGLLLGARVPVAPGMPTKSAPDLPDVGPDVQHAAVPAATAGRGATAATESRNATNTASAVGPDEQPASAGVAGLLRDRGQHEAALGGQCGDGLAGDRDVEGLRSTRHQRRGDVGDHAVGARRLGPQDGRGGLLDGQQGYQRAQHNPRDARDDGDEPGDGGQARSAQIRRVARGSMLGDAT